MDFFFLYFLLLTYSVMLLEVSKLCLTALQIRKSKFLNVKCDLSVSANVFVRLPSNSDMTWDRYVAPFSYDLWLAIAIAVCVLSVCLALTNYGHVREQDLTLPATFFYVFGCLCQQGETWNSYFPLVSLVDVCLNLCFLSSVPLVFFASFCQSPIPIPPLDLVYFFI